MIKFDNSAPLISPAEIYPSHQFFADKCMIVFHVRLWIICLKTLSMSRFA